MLEVMINAGQRIRKGDEVHSINDVSIACSHIVNSDFASSETTFKLIVPCDEPSK